jgi:hypothetical protein
MADNLTTFMCRLSRNLGASTSWNPQGLSRPARKYYLNTISYYRSWFTIYIKAVDVPSTGEMLVINFIKTGLLLQKLKRRSL